MKKLFAIALMISFLLSSCITTMGVKETYVIDYKRYSDKGFFLTESNSVSFGYTPIASVTTDVKGSMQTNTSSKQTNTSSKLSARDRRAGQAKKSTSQKYTVDDALDELVNKSNRLGADGIINLKIAIGHEKDWGIVYNISGMAIKIKQ